MDLSTIGSISNGGTDSIGANTLGKEDFLKLLLEQLSHQDPLNPLDSTEFTAQLSQFSSLEQLTNINSTLHDVLAFQQSMQNTSVANLIGKTVKVDGNSVYLSDKAEMNFELSDEASTGEISVYDAAGQLVWSKDLGPQMSGAQRYLWDGKDNSGNQLPEGSYTFEVKAQDISGNPVHALTSAVGTVSEVLFEDNLTFIILNDGTKVNLSDIKSVG
jgi:flagellar basal-body rod modification protein FlgD